VANEPKKSRGSKNGAMPTMVWLNYDLTAQDQERLRDKALVDNLHRFSLDDLIVEGFKFSLGPDERNNCYVAALTQKRESDPHYNHCLSGRGATPAHARISLLYRHLVLAEGNWAFFLSDVSTGEIEFR